MKPADTVGITFATQVLTRGCRNGVVNINMGAFEFNAGDEKVEPDLVCTLRLRTDVAGAMALRDALTELLRTIHAEAAAPSAPVEGDGSVAADEETAKH